MIKPRFSIVTITKNNLAGLRRTLHSLHEQRCQDYEWIVIDGGSTDGTLDHFKPALSEADKGIYDAMNKGLERAQGDYILFLNAGDTLVDPYILENIAPCHADFIYGDAIEGNHIKPAKHAIAQGMITHHQAMFYRRNKIGILRFDLSHPIAADYDFTWHFLKGCQTIIHIPLPVCNYEEGGWSQQRTKQGRREQFIIRRAMGVPIFVCCFIYARQSAAQAVRFLAPSLFWRARSRRSTAPVPAHNQSRARHRECPDAQNTHRKIQMSREAA